MAEFQDCVTECNLVTSEVNFGLMTNTFTKANATNVAAVRAAHEEVRRGIAAASTRLEGRQQRIAAFSATRVEAQQRMSDAVASARSEFESLLPKDEGGVLVEAERARLAAHAASRDAALAHEDRRKQLASLSPEKSKGATADDSVVSLSLIHI